MRSARSPILGNPDRLQDYPTRTGKKSPEPTQPPTTMRGTTWRKGVIIVTMRTLQQPITSYYNSVNSSDNSEERSYYNSVNSSDNSEERSYYNSVNS